LPIFAVDNNSLQQDEKLQLEQQLRDIESQIVQYQQELGGIKGEKNTLQNKIKQLQNQQATINLQIKSTNLQVFQLGNKLNETEQAIDEGIARTQRIQEQVAQLIRTINEYDNYPILYVILTSDNLSDIFDEMEAYFQMSVGLNDLFVQMTQTKSQLNQQAQSLAQQQDEAQNLLAIKILAQQQLAGSVNEQNGLLQETKGKEANYQSILSSAQKKAAEIKGRLYPTLGVSTQVTFGEAVLLAQWASEQTGVRAAFLLAVLTQESNLGKNVGTCNRSGDGPEKSWKVVMKPDRDQEPFLQITGELGLNPDTTPISCPMRDSKGKQVGWGGAMGPAQFIPSTWMGYKDRVAAITGKTANPWDIRDAFIAAAIKLKAGGAGVKSGEWAAAMRYFSGSTNLKYRFYGDNVVAIANQYQNDIDNMGS
jgi:peptidoglycan hydrolase CwlO-like protein